MNNIVCSLKDATCSGAIVWSETSDPYAYSTSYSGETYTITSNPADKEAKKVYLCKWDDNGNPNKIEDAVEEQNLFQLFEMVLDKNSGFSVKYDKYRKEMEDYKNHSVSLYKVMKRLGYEAEEERPKIRIKENDYFYYANHEDKKYIQPPMTQLETIEGIITYDEANVILVSAPGATGKSAMSQYISSKLDIPILDLGKYDAVGANSIGGLLMKEVQSEDIFVYHDGLKSGRCSMIIDGLDEASIRITQDSFDAFMKDVAFFSKDSKGLPFVVLGRPAVMEEAALALELNEIKTALLQIEPFTINKAKDFIDRQISSSATERHDKHYKEVRDYIIEEIGGFFKSEADMNRNVFERFIGYAPVLMSIKTLLADNLDFHHLLDELRENKKQKIELVIDIVDRILIREQGKIHSEVLPQMFESGRNEQYKEDIMRKSGTKQEQCYRILSTLLGKVSSYNIFNDAKLDDKYNEKMNLWIRNHPFVDNIKRGFENIVFESYVIAKLINTEEYRELSLEWLKHTNSGSYLLMDIYNCLSSPRKEIDCKLLPYLLSSFKALDTLQDIGSVEILAKEDDGTPEYTVCELVLGRDADEKEYEFTFSLLKDDKLTIPSPLSSMNIDAPINILIDTTKTDFQTPVSIRCKKLILHSKDILLSNYQKNNRVIIECDEFEAICLDGSYPVLTNRSGNNDILRIFTDSTLSFPFYDFKVNIKECGLDDSLILERFMKFRRMILMFRSHSKGYLARCCSKIDNRIGKSELGEAIIDKLIQEEVMWSDNVMYYLNNERFASVIGVKYDDIRSCVINDKTRSFLKSLSIKKCAYKN